MSQVITESGTSDLELWQILPSDNVLLRADTNGKRCRNCKQLGHEAVHCSNPHKRPRCKLCGHSDHVESRCPNTICMQCGRPNFECTEYCGRCFYLRSRKCQLREQFGHTKDRCPDLWRRYHSTTKDGPLVVPDGPALKPAKELWCPNCAQQGHLEYECRRYGSSSYIKLNPTVIKYQDIYIGARTDTPKRSPQKSASSKEREREKLTLIESSVVEIRNRMSNDPELWQILPSDNVLLQADTNGKRCRNCKQLGHEAVHCSNPHKRPRCKLCGHSDHVESRCPNTICMQCGRPNFDCTEYCGRCFYLRSQKCQLCKQLGHTNDRCPDLWRRYHSTTTDGPLVVPDGPALKPANKLWCPNCAQQGHLEYECRRYNPSLYISVLPLRVIRDCLCYA